MPPVDHFGVGFYGKGYYGGTDEMNALEQAIQRVLHPGIPISYAEYCASRGIDPDLQPRDPKWRNALCDIQILWSHVYHGRDCLVTSDSGFFKESKVAELEKLGARHILRPDDAVIMLSSDPRGPLV